MKKHFLLFLLSLLFLLVVSSFVSASVSVTEDVLETCNQDGEARVIIELKESDNPSILEVEQFVQEELTAVASAVANANSLDDVDGSSENVVIEHTFEERGLVSATLSESALQALMDSENIASIVLDEPVSTFLDSSVPVLNATTTWSLQVNGTNITGRNQTICVIDTGIDYTHASLGGSLGVKVLGGYDFVNNDNDPIDDDGHGTHVAGTIAGNGILKGVAPDAYLVAMKALNSNGGGFSSDIIAAIDWCVNNKSIYNISVISMSLGGTINYTSACDSNGAINQAYASSINAAIAQNISVIIATGNSYNYSGVNSPGCIENATRVTATDDSDSFASFANRGGDFDDILAAPGVSICSSKFPSDTDGADCQDGTYITKSGTSMSTPHMAGIFALFQQYYSSLQGVLATPNYVESTLNSTGVVLYDSFSNKNYTRVDIYTALMQLDAQVPNVTLASSNNSYVINTSNVSLICNVADDFQIINVSLYHNASSWHLNQTNTSGVNNVNYSFSLSLETGDYSWNCQACDANNCSFSSANHTFFVRPDDDGDGIVNDTDNCPSIANTDQLDLDNDGMGDVCDIDADGDGINDVNDTIKGNVTSVNITSSIFTNLSLFVNASVNLTQNFTGEFPVELKNNNETILSFNFSFSNDTVLDLSNISLVTETDNTSNAYVIITGINLTNATKTVYLTRNDASANRICIKDEPIASVSQITTDCSNSTGNEYALTCDNTTVSGYTCEAINSTLYKVSGLSHSGVREYTFTAPSTSSSGGGGGGGGGGGLQRKESITFTGKSAAIPQAKVGTSYSFLVGTEKRTLKAMTSSGSYIRFSFSPPKTIFTTFVGETTFIDFEADGETDLEVSVDYIDGRTFGLVITQPQEEEEVSAFDALVDFAEKKEEAKRNELPKAVVTDVPITAAVVEELPSVIEESHSVHDQIGWLLSILGVLLLASVIVVVYQKDKK